MALDPLILNVRTLVEPIQRGRADERRQSGAGSSFGEPDRLATILARPKTAEDGKRAQAAGDRDGGRQTAAAVPFQPKEPPLPEKTDISGDYLSQAARLSRNDRGPFFAAIGFSAQQLASEADPAPSAPDPGRFERGLEAYRRAPRAEREPKIQFTGSEILIGLSEPTYPERVNLSA
ncbi:MAG: hypothetical protein HZC25_13585 [Rhodospirillales bacterium]|nr:hypothetical protein [Rhodospirillales bacterium]